MPEIVGKKMKPRPGGRPSATGTRGVGWAQTSLALSAANPNARGTSAKTARSQRAERADVHFEFCREPAGLLLPRPLAAQKAACPSRLTEACVERSRSSHHKQPETGVKLLWGTSNLFSHKRYMHGGPTNLDPDVRVHGGRADRSTRATTHKLGGDELSTTRMGTRPAEHGLREERASTATSRWTA